MTTQLRILFVTENSYNSLILLNHLIKTNYKIVGCITTTISPVNSLLKTHNIPICHDINNIEWITTLNIDCGIVMYYNKLIPKHIYSIPKYNFINIHYSCLPDFRGPLPVQSALLANVNITGVSFIIINDTYDTGDILYTIKCNIDNDDNYITLSNKLLNITLNSIDYVLNNLDVLYKNKTKQDTLPIFTSITINDIKKQLELNNSAEQVLQRIKSRAPNCYYNNICIYKANIIQSLPNAYTKKFYLDVNNKIIYIDGRIYLKCNDYYLHLTQYKFI